MNLLKKLLGSTKKKSAKKKENAPEIPPPVETVNPPGNPEDIENIPQDESILEIISEDSSENPVTEDTKSVDE